MPRWEKVRPSTSGSAALQKKAISAMAANRPVNSVVRKKPANPASAAIADRRTMATRAPSFSASQPHRFGASTRISCVSDIRMAMSVADRLTDCR